MIPGKSEFGQPNGISRVIEKYYEHGHVANIEFTEGNDFDLLVSHAGITGGDCDVAILHGLYFTGDYEASKAEYFANANIVQALRSAKAVTVPTQWVSEIIKRDLHITPFVVPHGIDWKEWEHNYSSEPYVLYNKNRDAFDVCDSSQLDKLANMATDVQFVSTFSKSNPSNVRVTKVLPHNEMKVLIQKAGVYASLTKETFGIGILEALASGVPVLGWRSGGNTDLIEHGVNGYLAEPGNYDDLVSGLFYIIKYRKVLSQNAIETAKIWSWDNAVRKLRVALDYAMSAVKQDPTVDVVIPVYNKAGTVERAIESVSKQTYPVSNIIVVNDGSTDNTSSVLTTLKSKYSNLVVVDKENGGVATARNLGAKQSRSKYISFLDADDEIDSRFVATCIESLEKDSSLYIAYTKLLFVDPKNGTQISRWPDKWDFDQQLKRKNQVPTCCVMRRQVIERTGGFRQRYAPLGAGSEDADLWTRAGALGMKAALVDTSPLFIYHGGGSTTNQGYREEDWLKWNGWQYTRQHPIASYATPIKLSHSVYQYDNPRVSVIVPVGPGHEEAIYEAIDSVEGQTYKQWELIVVNDSDKELDLSAWPFVQLYRTPHPRSGPGVARNIGAKAARGGFLIFLDADDWLAPDAIEKYLIGWNDGEGIVYSDYFGIATIPEENLGQFENRVVDYLPQKKRAVLKHYSDEYDCEKAQRQPNKDEHLYHWCIVTCLIPKAWHMEIGGFDEEMKSWEDVDYHWRMAKRGHCYTHIRDNLVYYRFDTGTRRQLANPESHREVSFELLEYMSQKFERIENMTCKKCGGGGQNPNVSYPDMSNPNVQPVMSAASNDADYRVIIYRHPNMGDHRVIGPSTGINYGYRSGGDKFLVHVDDIARMPQLFAVIEQAVMAEAPKVEQPEVQEPTLIETPATKKPRKTFDIETVPGVTPEISDALKRMGYTTQKKFKGITEEQLLKVDGMTPVRAKIIMMYINDSK